LVATDEAFDGEREVEGNDWFEAEVVVESSGVPLI